MVVVVVVLVVVVVVMPKMEQLLLVFWSHGEDGDDVKSLTQTIVQMTCCFVASTLHSSGGKRPHTNRHQARRHLIHVTSVAPACLEPTRIEEPRLTSRSSQ